MSVGVARTGGSVVCSVGADGCCGMRSLEACKEDGNWGRYMKCVFLKELFACRIPYSLGDLWM